MTLIATRPAGGGPTDSSPAALFGQALLMVRGEMSAVVSTPTFGLSGPELNALVAEASAVVSSVAELRARLTAEADSRGHATDEGCTSTTAWLRKTTGLSGSAAGRVTAQAREMFTERVAPTRSAWAAGDLTGEQALVIATAVNRLSPEVDAGRVAAAQADLIAQADEFSLEELRRLANRMVEVVDPETADELLAQQLEAEEKRALEATQMRFARCGDGTTRFAGRLPDLQADMFKKALDALAAPRRRRDCSGGGASAHCDESPAGDEEQPDVRATAPTLNPDGDYSGTEIGLLTHQQRLGRALVELLEHLPSDRLPQAGGLNASVVVSMELDTLMGGLGSAMLDTGTVLSGAEARRLACNATLVPAVLDGPSKVLDLGMSQRLFDRYQRLALIQRDRGCVWPGCDRPPAMCEAHHVKSWRLGGPTDLSNGALVCGFHHRLLHGGEWEARVAADGVVEIVPPARIDPRQVPRRHARFKERRPC